MKKILIILNAVVYNRGSEALIRGISKICKNQYKDCFITLVSAEEEFRKDTINIDEIDIYQRKLSYSQNSLVKYIVKLLEKLNIKTIADKIKYKKMVKTAKEQDIIFIIGADNYDITYNIQEDLNRFNTLIRKSTNAKMVLYDCSIDKRDITKTLIKDLNNFDYITVRESITKSNIEKYIDRSKLLYFPDPAFLMETKKIELPSVFRDNDVIGINVSNLITNSKYGSKIDIILNSYKKMIDYILDNTNMNVILIPHVMKNADLSTLKILYKQYEQNDRVQIISNERLNAQELKFIISNCRFFIGARTHATIAAYSSYVPTLVLGYSVKSKGIARDLFGTEEHYVLPICDLNSDNYLLEGFKWIYSNEEQIKNKLYAEIPEYINKVKATNELLKKCEGEII